MKLFLQLIAQSLATFWRPHAGTVAAAAVASAIMVGALVTGDSIKRSLQEQARERIGNAELAIVATGGFFREELADDLANQLGEEARATAILQSQAAASLPDGSMRSNQVQVYGVQNSFAQFSPKVPFPAEELERQGGTQPALINEILAARLALAPGDIFTLRLRPLTEISQDAPLGEVAQTPVPLRLEVAQILTADEFGQFHLGVAPSPPPAVFLPIERLQRSQDQLGLANTLLVKTVQPDQHISTDRAKSALAEVTDLQDLGLTLHELEETPSWEIQSANVFLNPEVRDAIFQAYPDAMPVLTYLVNKLDAGEQFTPYSMVAAVQPGDVTFMPEDFGPRDIAVNQWMADDTGVQPGDPLTLRYFVVNTGGGLVEQSAEFTVRQILPMTGPAADPRWMPDFPGLGDAENCREWETSLPIDLDLIRDKDEDYWDDYRGTPKAFITLAAGRELWGNRWGDLTAIRVEAPSEEALRKTLSDAVSPGAAGLMVQNLRDQARAASQSPVSFAGLAGGFGSLLIASSLALVALLFALNLESRSSQVGILLAQGWRVSQVRWYFLGEGAVLSAIGALLGVLPGIWYAQGMIMALTELWPRSVGSLELNFFWTPGSLLIGILSGILLPLLALAWTVMRLGKVPARDLLAGSSPFDTSRRGGRSTRFWRITTIVLFVLGVIGVAVAFVAPFQPGSFFGGAFFLVAAGLAGLRWVLARKMEAADAQEAPAESVAALGIRGSGLRPGRALVVAGTLAAGLFLVLASGSFRKYATGENVPPQSGGGYDIYASSTTPLLESPLTALPEELQENAAVLPFRVRGGDDASCLNLNAAQTPNVLGVDPAQAAESAFEFAALASDPPDPENPWSILNQDLGQNTVPVVIDQNTLVWALKMGLGDHLTLETETGATIRLQFVGALKTGVLQGNVIMEQEQLLRYFPSLEGHSLFLISAPGNKTDEVYIQLNRAYANYGLAAIPVAQRLQDFNSVENAYITIFQVLGGLGLLLATAGIGVVAMRNLLERRSAFALLQAIGWTPAQLRALARAELFYPALAGLIIGIVASILAVWPQMVSRGMSLGLVGWVFQGVLVVLITLLTWAAIAVAIRTALKSLSYRDIRSE